MLALVSTAAELTAPTLHAATSSPAEAEEVVIEEVQGETMMPAASLQYCARSTSFCRQQKRPTHPTVEALLLAVLSSQLVLCSVVVETETLSPT